jgi:hypothetical protein
MEHMQIHHALKKGTKNFHYTLVEFFVISLFHEMRIPMVDMKFQVYFKFSKNKIWKKIKSPSSMGNGRFDTPKCRGKVQKMGVLYTHPKEAQALVTCKGL